MKGYLVTTGLLFALITLVHLARAVAERGHLMASPGFAFGMTVLTVLPGALSWWAWKLLSAGRKTKNEESNK
jgi:ammonia channel protein AmtB